MSKSIKVENPLEALRNVYVFSSKELGDSKATAWCYGIIVGWPDDAYMELQRKYDWSDSEVLENKRLHKRFHHMRIQGNKDQYHVIG